MIFKSIVLNNGHNIKITVMLYLYFPKLIVIESVISGKNSAVNRFCCASIS